VGPHSASYCRRRSPLVEKTTGASRRHSGDKTTGATTPCSKTRGWQGCTAAPAPASTGGCSHRPTPPCELFFPPSSRQKAPRRRDGSTGPSRGNPQKPFANRREDGCLHDEVGAEIVQLHPVDVQNRPHEITCRHSKPPLVKRDEAQHIPQRRGRGGSALRGHPLWLWVTGERTKQTISNKGLQIVRPDGGGRPPDPSLRRKRATSPPTDQRFEGWPLRRARQPPQSTQAPRLLLIRGSKAGTSEGFDSRLRALGLHAHYWSEVRRLARQRGSTAASDHLGSTPTTDQGFVGWPPKGSTAASEHAKRGMTLGTSDTWPRLGLRSRGTLGHF
jgi:hypothetical protein